MSPKSLFEASELLPLPFPVRKADVAIDPNVFSSLCESFPAEFAEEVMGGRRRLSNEDEAFYVFLERNSDWKLFYEKVNSDEFARSLLRLLTPTESGSTHGLSLDPGSIQLDRTYLKRRMENARKFPRLATRAISKGHSLMRGPEQVYFHFDISTGMPGYEREIHRDSRPRLAAFLIYFSDAVDGDGGEFKIHEYKSQPPSYETQPANEVMREVWSLKPKSNVGVCFLSTPNSYHSVSRVSQSSQPRKFIYVGLSQIRGNPWST